MPMMGSEPVMMTPYLRDAMSRMRDAGDAGLSVRAAFPTGARMVELVRSGLAEYVCGSPLLEARFRLTPAGLSALQATEHTK